MKEVSKMIMKKNYEAHEMYDVSAGSRVMVIKCMLKIFNLLLIHDTNFRSSKMFLNSRNQKQPEDTYFVCLPIYTY